MGAVTPKEMSRSLSAYGRLRNRMRSTTLNTEVVAPIPTAMERIATQLKARFRVSIRRAERIVNLTPPRRERFPSLFATTVAPGTSNRLVSVDQAKLTILTISGSLRSASTNTAVLEAMAYVAPQDVQIVPYS